MDSNNVPNCSGDGPPNLQGADVPIAEPVVQQAGIDDPPLHFDAGMINHNVLMAQHFFELQQPNFPIANFGLQLLYNEAHQQLLGVSQGPAIPFGNLQVPQPAVIQAPPGLLMPNVNWQGNQNSPVNGSVQQVATSSASHPNVGSAPSRPPTPDGSIRNVPGTQHPCVVVAPWDPAWNRQVSGAPGASHGFTAPPPGWEPAGSINAPENKNQRSQQQVNAVSGIGQENLQASDNDSTLHQDLAGPPSVNSVMSQAQTQSGPSSVNSNHNGSSDQPGSSGFGVTDMVGTFKCPITIEAELFDFLYRNLSVCGYLGAENAQLRISSDSAREEAEVTIREGRSEITRLQDQLSNSENAQARLRSRVARLRDRLETANDNIEETNQKLDWLKDRSGDEMTRLINDVIKSRNQAEEAQRSANERIEVLNGQHANMQRELGEAREIQSRDASRISGLAEESDRLRRQLRAAEDRVNLNDHALAETIKIRQELIDAQNVAQSLREEIEVLAERLRSKQATSNQLLAETERLRQETVATVSSLSNQLVDLQMELSITQDRAGATNGRLREENLQMGRTIEMEVNDSVARALRDLVEQIARTAEEDQMRVETERVRQETVATVASLSSQVVHLQTELFMSEDRAGATIGSLREESSQLGCTIEIERNESVSRALRDLVDQTARTAQEALTAQDQMSRRDQLAIQRLFDADDIGHTYIRSARVSEEPDPNQPGPSGLPRRNNRDLLPPAFADIHGDYMRDQWATRRVLESSDVRSARLPEELVDPNQPGTSGLPRDSNSVLLPPVFPDDHADYMREDQRATRRVSDIDEYEHPVGSDCISEGPEDSDGLLPLDFQDGNAEGGMEGYGSIQDWERENHEDQEEPEDQEDDKGTLEPAPRFYVLFDQTRKKGYGKRKPKAVEVSKVKAAMEHYRLPGVYNNKKPRRRPESAVRHKLGFDATDAHFRKLRQYERQGGIVLSVQEFNYSVAVELTRRVVAVGRVRVGDLRAMVDQVVTDMQISPPYSFDDAALAKWKSQNPTLWY